MEGNISVERVYKLSDYNTLRLGGSFDEIPVELFLDNAFVSKIRWLMFIQSELDYRRYILLLHELKEFNLEEATKYLEAIRLDTLKELKNIIMPVPVKLEYKIEEKEE